MRALLFLVIRTIASASAYFWFYFFWNDPEVS